MKLALHSRNVRVGRGLRARLVALAVLTAVLGSSSCDGGSSNVIPIDVGSIGDRVWNDLNCDGFEDLGEPGLVGVGVRVLDESGNVVAQVMTGPGGHWLVEDLGLGSWVVEVSVGMLPPTFLPSPPGADSHTSPVTVVLDKVDFAPRNVDFGYCSPCSGTLGDRVWRDLDCDGIQDPGEGGIPGVLVELLDPQDQVLAVTATGALGNYRFDGLCAGDYRVVIDATTLPAGWYPTFVGQGTDPALDSNGSPADVTLADDDTVDLTVDFGYCPPCSATLGDRVWRDLDCDGIQDAGEPGIAGVRIELRDDQGALTDQVFTNGQGLYAFQGVCLGTWEVAVDASTLPPNVFAAPCDVGSNDALDNDCSPVTVVLASPQDLTVDFGYCNDRVGEIGDRVWNDLDCNGLQDPGEPGLDGVTLRLFDAQSVELDTQVTAGDGAYSFQGLAAGTYVVEVDEGMLPPLFAPAPCDVGADDAADNDCSPVTVMLATDEMNATVDFGYCAPNGSIGDVVWLDRNGDGLQDLAEPGIAGVTVTAADEQAVIVATDVTDGQGRYELTGLPAGDWVVAVDPTTLPPGLTPSPCDVGLDDALDNDCSPVTVNLPTPTTRDASVDFGYTPPCDAEVGDFVWHDLDGDGLQDPGEPGISGVRLLLRDTGGAIVATAETNANGKYLIPGLCTGAYVLEVSPNTLPPGFVPAPCDAGPDDVDNDCSPVAVFLPANWTVDHSFDFGFVATWTGSLGDLVWHDLDGDGLQEPGEPGLGGVPVELSDDQDVLLASTVTDPTGHYEFPGLPAGSYRVKVDPRPPGFLAAPPNVGPDDTVDSDGPVAMVVLPTNQTRDDTVDFGLVSTGLGTLGDFVWYDLDGDGLQDFGEPGLAGLTVVLLDSAGNTLSTDVTDGAGFYLFRGISPGDYLVMVDPLPVGLVLSPPYVGPDDSVDSSPLREAVQFQGAEVRLDVDFGFRDP